MVYITFCFHYKNLEIIWIIIQIKINQEGFIMICNVKLRLLKNFHFRLRANLEK